MPVRVLAKVDTEVELDDDAIACALLQRAKQIVIAKDPKQAVGRHRCEDGGYDWYTCASCELIYPGNILEKSFAAPEGVKYLIDAANELSLGIVLRAKCNCTNDE